MLSLPGVVAEPLLPSEGSVEVSQRSRSDVEAHQVRAPASALPASGMCFLRQYWRGL